MKTYKVRIEYTAVCYETVQAENEADAEKEAIAMADETVSNQLTVHSVDVKEVE